MRTPGEFGAGYATALAGYFASGDEGALSLAYQLGRRAIRDGLGILDVVALHQETVEDQLSTVSTIERSRLGHQAGDFLRETLSPFEMSFRGYRDANGQLTRLNEQLTEQRDAVALVNRELESFSYSVSHDLRAPLRSVDGFSQALLEDCADALDADGRKYLHFIRDAAKEMSQLIDDLLRLARVTSAEVLRGEVDLSALARHVIDRLRASQPARQAEIVVEEGLRAVADPPLLGILLENLLGNAWKFTSRCEHARIELGQTHEDNRPVIFVRDNGAGFDMAQAPRLFGAFQRLHTSHEFEGTGIGLATVQRIVHRHGGRVWAEGKVGQGATFFFTLGAPGATA